MIKFLVAQIVEQEIFIQFICLFPTRDRHLNYLLIIYIQSKPKARGINIAAKIIQLEISPARDIYLQLEVDIYLQLDRNISLVRK